MVESSAALIGNAEEEAPLTASILLVDDHPANLLALEAVLEPLGHRLVKARSGEEALSHLLRESFALILMDVQMPGMDGFQTVALIKQRQETMHTPIMFVTAIAKETEHISKGYQYGAVDYLMKPFDPDILKAKVSVLVALYLQAERIAAQREMLLQRRHELAMSEAKRDASERANAMKDHFLAVVSHELRTPLHVITGWIDLLVKGGLDEERTRHALAVIQRNAGLQKQLVDDLLDISRLVMGKLSLNMAPLRLEHVVASAIDAVSLQAHEKQVKVAAALGQGADIVGDAARLQQAVLNLLVNAIKFTPTGGAVQVSLQTNEAHARIEIADTGVGIAPDHLPRVFDRFWQAESEPARRQPGLGLGLAIVRQLIELHGGATDAKSDGLGKGATFSVTLPLPAN